MVFWRLFGRGILPQRECSKVVEYSVDRLEGLSTHKVRSYVWPTPTENILPALTLVVSVLLYDEVRCMHII